MLRIHDERIDQGQILPVNKLLSPNESYSSRKKNYMWIKSEKSQLEMHLNILTTKTVT